MTDLPDFNKITFPEMLPIPLEQIVPDASPDVGRFMCMFVHWFFDFVLTSGVRSTETISGLFLSKKNISSRGNVLCLLPLTEYVAVISSRYQI